MPEKKKRKVQSKEVAKPEKLEAAAQAGEAEEDVPAEPPKKRKLESGKKKQTEEPQEEVASAADAAGKKKKKKAAAAEAEVAEAAAEVEPKKAKKSRSKEADGVEEGEEPQTKGAEKDSEEDKSKHKHTKRNLKSITRKALEAAKTSQEAGDEQTPALSEEDRIEASRKIQSLVRKMRDEGKDELEIESAKQDLKRELGTLRKPNSRRSVKFKAWEEWLETKEAKEKRKAKASREHELVVIPVVWRGRHDRLDIIKAADDVKALVAQQGVDCWIDARRHYTPGQKFAHWEHRGVLLRVEIGPEDYASGLCRVCKAHTPGDYLSVERKKVRLPPAGARQLLLQLKEWGLSQIEIERRPGDSEDEEDAEAAAAAPDTANAAGKAAADESQPVDEDLAGNWQPFQAKQKTKEARPKYRHKKPQNF
mmetsp:Transcript_48866/g.116159  ORF Transcript_48866/g.116159 Transcript_48866/m.116159 type:complete len:422 (+) Transcript_48866:59-1324(+)